MDHAEVRPTLEEGVEEARRLFEELIEAGVDYDEVVVAMKDHRITKGNGLTNALLSGLRRRSGYL